MRKTTVIPFKQFMSGEFQDKVAKVKEIRKGKIYKILLVSGLTAIVLLSGDLVSAQEVVTAVAGDEAIEKGANLIYGKLLLVGKWIIIVKGGVATINNMLQEDYGAAKRGFLTYLVVYVILHGLPWSLAQVDTVFRGM